MEAFPGDALMQLIAFLAQKRIPSSLHEDYRKWMRYYLESQLDF